MHRRAWVYSVAIVSAASGCEEMKEAEPTRSPFSLLPSSKSSEQDDASGSDGLEVAADPAGITASLSTLDFATGPSNAFFARLGTNGRTCNSCHLQDQGWTIAARKLGDLAADDPLFAPVDGSDCAPSSAGQKPDAARSTMLVRYGLIRIELAIPEGADFSLARATNPQDCVIAPGSPAIDGELFLFRRPLPTANLEFVPALMWDGRETLQTLTQGTQSTSTGPLRFDLAHQDDIATRGHEQSADSILGTPTVGDLLGFETALYAAELTLGSLHLDADGAHGGPRYLAHVVAPSFFIGENDPAAPGFTNRVFRLFEAWEPGSRRANRRRLTDGQSSVGRGERIFNTRTFTISDVPGLNSSKADPLANPEDPLFDKPATGTCSTCHNAFEVGAHSTPSFLNIGVALARASSASGRPEVGLDVENLPVYTLRAETGATVDVTDPGRALVSGRFVDAGKTKVPSLRALSARAPYFHNGSARDLATVVRFYNGRFGIGLTAEEQRDLVAFLAAL